MADWVNARGATLEKLQAQSGLWGGGAYAGSTRQGHHAVGRNGRRAVIVCLKLIGM